MIFNNNTIYARVWKATPAESGKYIDLQISTSEKGDDGNYKYSNWFPRAIGHANNSLKGVKEGDRITITKSKFTNESYLAKDGSKKSAFQFVILEATIGEGTTVKENTPSPTLTNVVTETNDEDAPW